MRTAGATFRRQALAAAALVGLLGAAPAGAEPGDACPASTGCLVEGGHYRALLPEGRPSDRSGALVYFHGWLGSAEEVVADAEMRAMANRLGIVLIAPDGMGRTWSYPGAPGQHRDEFRFVAAVMADARIRFGLDPKRTIVSGFSQGGSMAWYVACRMPNAAAGFIPVAGAFWMPLPPACEGERPPMVHIHGAADTTVPMTGRRLASGFQQGDVRRSIAIIAPACHGWRPAPSIAGLSCEALSGCDGESTLHLCLHNGGHVVSARWLEAAWPVVLAKAAEATRRTP